MADGWTRDSEKVESREETMAGKVVDRGRTTDAYRLPKRAMKPSLALGKWKPTTKRASTHSKVVDESRRLLRLHHAEAIYFTLCISVTTLQSACNPYRPPTTDYRLPTTDGSLQIRTFYLLYSVRYCGGCDERERVCVCACICRSGAGVRLCHTGIPSLQST